MRVILPPPPVSQTHSAGKDGAQQILPSLVRRFDGIGFDCQLSQPEFEARAALDVKYASYWGGGKATKDIGAHFEVRTVQQRRLGMMTRALTDCEPPPPPLPLIPTCSATPSPPPPPAQRSGTPSAVSLSAAKLPPLPVTQQHLLRSTAHQSKAPNPIRVDLGLPGISFSAA